MTKTLLVIDDDKSITMIVAKIASALGYNVCTVNDPVDALEAFEAIKPDVVMLDMIMPNLDGIDVLREILGADTGTKIILMSGFGPGYLRLAQAVAEFHHHPSVQQLAKPFRRAELVALLAGASTGLQPMSTDAPQAHTDLVAA